MDTTDTVTLERPMTTPASVESESLTGAMPQDAVSEIDRFFSDPEEYSIQKEQSPPPAEIPAAEGPQAETTPTNLSLDDLDLETTPSNGEGEYVAITESPEVQADPVSEPVIVEEQIEIDPNFSLNLNELAIEESDVQTAESVTTSQKPLDVKTAAPIEPEEPIADAEVAVVTTPEENPQQYEDSASTENPAATEALGIALAAALATNSAIGSVEKYPYDGELAAHLEDTVPTYNETQQRSALQRKVAEYLNTHGGDVVPPDVYEQLCTETQSPEVDDGTITFEQALTTPGRKRFESILKLVMEGGSIDTDLENDSSNYDIELTSLETPTAVLDAFFDKFIKQTHHEN